MRIKIREIIEASNALNKLFNLALKTTAGYELSKLIEPVNRTLDTAQKIKTKLISKYGEYDSDGKMTISKSNMDEINHKLDAYFDSDYDVSYNPISINDLPEQTDLTPIDFLNLKTFIKENYNAN